MEWSLNPSSEYFKSLSPSVQKRITCEKAIARAIVKEALKRGYFVTVYDGEEYVLDLSRSVTKVVNALHTTDEDCLIIFDQNKKRLGHFYLVYGNSGWDVVSDYSWQETPTRNTKDEMDSLYAAGSIVSDKWEKILD